MAPPTSPALKILMLHGYTQSGPLFHAKTRALEKAIQKAFPNSTLHYPTGPIPLYASDIPGYVANGTEETAADASGETESYGWWRRKEGSTIYSGLEKGLSRIAETINTDGPFDGVIGFSQGGCAAAILTSLLEPGRKAAFDALKAAPSPSEQAEETFPYPDSFVKSDGNMIQSPFKFAAIYSAFAAPKEAYEALYSPRITTPSVHFLGGLDTVVSEERSRFLAEQCFEGARIMVHPGGHFLPSQKVWIEGLLGFIRERVVVEEVKAAVENVEGVEDMDVPF